MQTLNPKQSRFIQEYLIDLNATQAAIRAGYSKKTAGQMGFDLLKKPEIQSAIQKRRNDLAKKAEVTQERIIAEYAKLAFSNAIDYVRVNSEGLPVIDFGDTTQSQFAAIAEVQTETVVEGRDQDTQIVRKTKFKLHDKKGALDSLARHLGMFIDKSEVNLNVQGDLLGLSELPDDELDKRIERIKARKVDKAI